MFSCSLTAKLCFKRQASSFMLSNLDLQTQSLVFCSLNSFELPSPAHRTSRKAEADVVQGLTSAAPTRPTVNPGQVDLCVRGAPGESLQGLRATCRRLIVQTGGVQTVPDIQHEDTIKMSPFPTLSLRLKTKIKLL